MSASGISRPIAVIVGILLLASASIGSYAVLRYLSPQKSKTVDTQATAPEPAAPEIDTSVVIAGLENPWEVAFLPDRTMVITERSGTISKISAGTATRLYKPSDVVVRGEGGLMGLAVDPDFAQNRYVYVCYNSSRQGIVVARVRINEGVTSAQEDKKIITNIPSNSSGRHSGCRLAFGPDEYLWVGTGDAADESTPQDLDSLGGKILHVTRDGRGVDGNISDGDNRIYSYGHRNTQGLAMYESAIDGSYGLSVEHGTDRDDEINELTPGNFGWQPGPGYDESAPMTDTTKFPNAIRAVWSSGDPTIAPSDADFLRGDAWGIWEGRLAMGVLKDKHLRILDIADGRVKSQERVLDGSFGRLRGVTMGPDGSLYITTDSNADGKILKVTPSAN